MVAKQTTVRSIHERGRGVRAWPIWKVPDWPVWSLPGWLRVFIAAVVLADAAVLGLAASSATLHLHHLVLFAGLLACSAATVELTRRVGENVGMVKDVYATWELPAALLLPLSRAATPIETVTCTRSPPVAPGAMTLTLAMLARTRSAIRNASTARV